MRFAALAAVFLAGVAWFALIGALLVHVAIEDFRDLRTLARLQCPACKRAYGKTTARRSKAKYQRECDDAVRQIEADKEPGSVIVDVNFDNEWPVECPHCGHCAKSSAHHRNLVENPLAAKSIQNG